MRLSFMGLLALGGIEYSPTIKVKPTLTNKCPYHGETCPAMRPHCAQCGVGLREGHCVNPACQKSFEGRQTLKGVKE